jgi:DHA1 family tetracycline resistance protein-like MFS transporter
MGEPRRAAFVFIFVTVVLDMVAMGMVIPVLPRLVVGFTGGDTRRGAEIFGVFGTVWALMQFGLAPVLGSLSDRYGRRPVILLSNFGLGFDYILMAMAPTLAWLFAGRVISGITAASVPTAFAYIADVTPPEKRAQRFGWVSAAFGLGFVLGPALGGFLGGFHPRLPFWVAAGLSLANAMYGLFVLPESLAPAQRAPFRWARANPLGALNLLRRHRELLGLAAVYFFFYLGHEVLPNVFVLYAGYRYHWGERAVGFTLAAVGVCVALVQAALIKPAVARLGERRALLLGLLCGVAGFVIYGAAARGLWFWAGIPVMALWGFAGAAGQGLMTRHVAPSEQGQLQGALQSLRGITGLLGPGLFTQTFAMFLKTAPGAPFFLAAGLLAVAFALAGRVTRPAPLSATAA